MALMGTLSEKLSHIFKKITGRGKLTELEIKNAMREIRIALLEADVNYKVAKDFINKVTEKAVGEKVLESLTPDQQVIKIVRDELTSLMGDKNAKLEVASNPPTIILMCGLQGAGKTSTCGKLGLYLKKQGKKPLLVACDIYRPAAIKQLQVVGSQLNIPVFANENTKDVVLIAKQALSMAMSKLNDVVIIDTAGRLHIDDNLMEELQNIKQEVKPEETLLVIDSMMGQDAINVITGFNSKLDLTGVILTKLDGDTRGGVALSVRHLTNVPIKFIGDSEKMDGIDYFYPDRMASRILGMGDILSIVDKANEVIDEKEAEKSLKKMQKGKFDLEDFLSQMKQIKKLGPLENLLKLIPGASKMGLNNVNIDSKRLSHIEAIILSMTPYERKHPEILKASRKERIAKGSGRNVMEVNRLLTQFEQSKKMMKMISNGNMKLPF